MGDTEAKAPDIKAEETLVRDDERIVLPETPELPPAVETTLDTFIEALSLEDSAPAEFVLASALAATAERFGPNEAETMLSQFDQELTAQFFEQLLETGDIPQSPSMNNLLTGDVNNPAAQFILENLAAQCASGAFNTVQSALRAGSTAENKNGSKRKSSVAETLRLMDSIDNILSTGFASYDSARTDQERQVAYNNTVDAAMAVYREQNPDATEAELQAARELIEKITQADIVSKYAEQLANGQITRAEYLEKLNALRDEFAQNPQLQAYVLELDEINEDLEATEELLKAAEDLLQQGNHNAHVVTHYQAKIAELKEAQLQKIQEIQEYRDSMQGQLSELSMEGLDARLAQEQAELARLQTIQNDLNNMVQDATKVAADSKALEADVNDAKLDHTMAKTDRMIDEMGLGSAITDHHSMTRELRTEGFATIRLTHIGDTLVPSDMMNPRQAFDFDIKFTAGLEDGVDHVVQKDENGEMFVQTADGQKIVLDEGMQRYIETSHATDISAANFELTGTALEQYTHSLIQTETHRDALETSTSREAETLQRLEGLLSNTDLKRAELDALGMQRAEMQERIDFFRANGDDVTDLVKQIAEFDEQIATATTALNNIGNSFGSVFNNYQSPELNDSLTFNTEFTLDTDFSTIDLNSNDSIIGGFSLGNSLYTDPALSSDSIFSLDYNFDFGDYDTLTFDDSFLTQLDLAETYIADLDFEPLNNDLDSIEANLEAEIHSMKIQLLTDAGVPPELHEAFIKDMEYSLLTGTCASNTNIGSQLGTNGPLSADGGLMGSFGANAFDAQSMEAFRLTSVAESFAFTPEGERYKELLQSLNEMKGVTTEQAIAAAAAETTETADAPAPAGPATEANEKLINDAQNYAATAMGTITPQDILDQFGIDSVDSPEYAQIVEAMQDVITMRNAGLTEPVATIAKVETEEPEPTMEETFEVASNGPANDRSIYEPGALTI